MKRRRSGEAVELILEALKVSKPDRLSYADLELFTGLHRTTLRENVRALWKEGRIECHQDDKRFVWVQLTE
jgi:DNA-binding IclR family transcriptional regulator